MFILYEQYKIQTKINRKMHLLKYDSLFEGFGVRV